MGQTRRRAIIYCRISKDREGAGLGVDRQRQDCEELAARLGYEVVAVYVDNDLSAYTGKPRPGYMSLLADLQAGRADAVLCWHTDRLHRSPTELEHYITTCDARDVVTHTVQAGELDLATPSGRAVARTLGVWARFESEHKSERTRRAKLETAVGGGWTGGGRPFGFEDDGLTPRPTEAEAIKTGTDQVLAGVSLGQIARDWAASGLTTVGGRAWDATEVRRVLERPRNAGISVYQGREVARLGGDPVVAEDRWRAVAALLGEESRRTGPGPERRWLGSGLYRCGVCEGRMRSGATRPPKSRGGTRPTTPVYRCGAGVARHVVRDAVLLDAFVSEAICARLGRPDAVRVLAPPARSDGAELAVRALTLRTRLDELAAAFADGDISASQLREGSERLRSKLATIEAAMGEQARGSVFEGLVGVDDVSAAWGTLVLSRRRAVLDAMVRVTVRPAPRGRPAGWRSGDTYFSGDHIGLDWLLF